MPAISTLPSVTPVAAAIVPLVQSGVTSRTTLASLFDTYTGFTQSGTGATARTVQAKLRDTVSVKDFGAVGNGTTDDSSAVNAAIAALGAAGGSVYFPPGTYLLSSGLTITTPGYLRLYGAGGATGNAVSTIYCKNLTGYVFEPSGLGRQLILEDLVFDGRNGAAASHANNSTTWRGVVSINNIEFANLKVNRVHAFGSNALYPMWDLRKAFFTNFSNCYFGNWHLHRILQIAGGAITSTTVTFDKCYFNYAREIAYVQEILDCQFRSCVFESSVVALAISGGTTLLSGCYFENIGYDNSSTGLTTGVTDRAFGVADAPAITGNVSAAITARYGQTTLLNCRLSSITNTTKWLDGIGRGSAADAGGVLRLINTSHTYVGADTLFAADGDTPSSKGDFEYVVESGPLYREYLKYADARLCAAGRFKIDFSDANRRLITVKSGSFLLPPDATLGFTAIPTVYPANGQWAVGDEITRTTATQAAGKSLTWRCTVAGTPGSWDVTDFIPVSKSMNIAAAGTGDFSATLDGTTGDTHVWEVIATDNNTSIGYHATVVVSLLASDRAIRVTEHVDSVTGAITLQTNANAYTLRYTNGGAGAVNVYARLIRVYNVHA